MIGSGGMGVVFRGRDPALDRPLAIKVLQLHRSGARAQVRFLDEARAMARLRHPGVLPVFDVGRIESQLFVVMPLVTGGTLHEWMSKTRRPWREVVERFISAGRGLAAAHAAGFIHRDFKPANVLVDGDGSVMVADFGIAAHLHDGSDPRTSAVMSSVAGTPAYMAPEQARGHAIDERADQYSFCVSLWEGLHGERPQQGSTHTSVGRFASSNAFRARRHHDTPGWLDDAVLRGLATDPAQRWPSMTSLLDHLQTRLEESSSIADVDRRRPIRWPRRIAAIGVAAAVAIAIVAATREATRDGTTARAAPTVASPPTPASAPVLPVGAIPPSSPPPRVQSPTPTRRTPKAPPPALSPPAETDLSASRF